MVFRSQFYNRYDRFVWQRCKLIEANLVDKRVMVHNGKSFVSLLIRTDMVGFTFGMFVMTKKSGRIHRGVKRKSK